MQNTKQEEPAKVPVSGGEITGLTNASGALQNHLTALKERVERAQKIEQTVVDEKVRLNKKIASDKDYAILVSMVGGIDAMVGKTAEQSRKDIDSVIEQIGTSLNTIVQLSAQVKIKYGNVSTGRARRAGESTPNITAIKKEEYLGNPNFAPYQISFEPLDDGVHHRMKYTRNGKPGESIYIQSWMRDVARG